MDRFPCNRDLRHERVKEATKDLTDGSIKIARWSFQ